ncbi:YbaK/aminoacyl-tRNA synthetase-associated domain-containing protein [Entamoeba marina]
MEALNKIDKLLDTLTGGNVPSSEPKQHLTNPRPLECSYRKLDTLLTIITDEEPFGTIRMTSSCLSRVSSDYYEQSLEQRKEQLNTENINQLCKSLILENTAFPEGAEQTPTFSRFYLLIVQYISQMQSHKLYKYLRRVNPTVHKKYFHFRVADESEALNLAGFEHNAITPFGMIKDIPIVLADDITELPGDYCWIGGGEVDVKLGFNVKEFLNKVNPMVTDIYKREEDEEQEETTKLKKEA